MSTRTESRASTKPPRARAQTVRAQVSGLRTRLLACLLAHLPPCPLAHSASFTRVPGTRIFPGDVLGCLYDARAREVSWTLGGRCMGPPVALLEGRSTRLAFFVRLDSVAGTAVRLVRSAARRAPLDITALHAAAGAGQQGAVRLEKVEHGVVLLNKICGDG